MKNVGLPTFLLGADMTKREHSQTMGSKTYVWKATKNLEKIFGQFKKEQVPMFPGDHLEDDESKELNQTDWELFQMLIGTARWIISLGKIYFVCSFGIGQFQCKPKRWAPYPST